MGAIEQLTYSSVRIECILSNGQVATGTGFHMILARRGDTHIPVIVTNKHVIANATTGRFHLTVAKADGSPDLGKHISYEVNDFESKCIKHPDPNIDLAAFPITPLLHKAAQDGITLFYKSLVTDLIPSAEERNGLSPMEDIIMIGYPNGIWDSVHNMPVIRKGITATHPSINWNGKREFLTDIASFPGSSGSPVLLANIGSYTDNVGNVNIGATRIKLLGIHYAGALHNASGSIEIVTTPTANTPIPITQIPNNIGVAINSEEIFTLEKAVDQALPE